MEDRLQDGRGVGRDPHPEEPVGAVSKDGQIWASWFEAREDALLTMRNDYAAAAVTTWTRSNSRFDCER